MSRYDLIVVGSGPAGASLVHRLAPTGKRILLIERGDYLPRSRANWDAKTVFADGVYQAAETWYGRHGEAFHPGLHYYVGGNSKVYGAALLRLRERDFGEVVHQHGVSPAWPLGYADFEPFYSEAEALFAVHGQRGEDPLEPPAERTLPVSCRCRMNRAIAAARDASPQMVSTHFIYRSAFASRNARASLLRPASAFAATLSTVFPAC